MKVETDTTFMRQFTNDLNATIAFDMDSEEVLITAVDGANVVQIAIPWSAWDNMTKDMSLVRYMASEARAKTIDYVKGRDEIRNSPDGSDYNDASKELWNEVVEDVTRVE